VPGLSEGCQPSAAALSVWEAPASRTFRDYGFARARSTSAMVIIIVIGSIGDS
jgi:hypothetical protein